MIKKIGIILFFLASVGARHAVPLQDLTFAATQENGQPCPPECVTDSLEIITYYPSPYGYYEELRGDKIIVGDSDNSYINETDLPPSGTITFEPKSYAQITTEGTLYEGTVYYDSFDHEFKYYDEASTWQPLGGGGDYWKPSVANTDNIYYNTGNVGIGVNDPQAKLHINGNLRIDVAPFSSSAVATSNYIPINIQGTVYYLQLYKDAGNVMLVGSSHSVSDCLNANGMLYEVSPNQYTCKFSPMSSCPSGWSQYLNYSSTTIHGCSNSSPCTGGCTTSFHSWANISIETCNYDTQTYYSNAGCMGCVGCVSTCYATIQEIGCK